MLKLSTCQETAFEKIKFFLQDQREDYEPVILLNGSAGVGKSTLMRYVVNFLRTQTQLAIAIIAPTHKALRVILEMLNSSTNSDLSSFYDIPGYTLASILGKIKEHSYIGTKKFSEANTSKMSNYDIFILDEVSMVCDEDLEHIFKFVCENDKKLILIGDNCQIPSPSQKIKSKQEYCYKPDSMAFDILNKITLREIVRQQQDSVIIKIATFLRDNLKNDFSIHQILQQCHIDPEQVLVPASNAVYTQIADDILVRNLSSKIICYTNEHVKHHNMQLRRALGRTQQFCIGEVIVGYTNGTKIENGSEYVITQVTSVDHFRINKFAHLHGNNLTLVNFYDRKETCQVFAISIEHPQNASFMQQLITLAQQVNRRHSTLNDYREYMKLKRQAIFIDDVYKFENKIYNETELKKTHPLLFVPVLDIIGEKKRKKIPSDMAESIESLYPYLIDARIDDTSKGFTENEVFADMFKIVEKDIFYGYAITSHKSQGSTYDCVYVDENDFSKIKDRWNPKFQQLEFRIKEKNQLRYVAYTRASKELKIFL